MRYEPLGEMISASNQYEKLIRTKRTLEKIKKTVDEHFSKNLFREKPDVEEMASRFYEMKRILDVHFIGHEL